MQLVEQHVIKRGNSRYDAIDEAAFQSKNLYNAANYEIRQAFIFQGKYLNYSTLQKRMQCHEAYKALPAKVAQQVLMLLDKNWESYFKACQVYREDPSKFLGHPKLPKYKDKVKGRNILVYTDQAISRKALKKGYIQPSMLPIRVKTRLTQINQVRIVPRNGYYVVEAIYERKEQQAQGDPNLYAGIDIGVNNLAAIVSNKPGFVPRLVNGRPIKSTNQYYNKRKAQLQKKLGKTGSTRRMERLTNKRNRRINHYLHTASKRIIDLLVHEGIGTLVVGKNPNWKQAIEIGKRNNQNFVQIPHARFIEMLSYKAQLVGIRVTITEESYTSKCSFLDNEPVCKHECYLGKRVKRGLFRAAGGQYINADINGSYNILRKVAPKGFEGVEGFVVHPIRIALTKQTKGVAS
ncbi:MAG: transposase [Ktedonobacteraceae bacterium]|nr:transposase [Ktedonobacteraceae bacterium]MBO0790311.1 transposase [Ktedonobacteraceae bacterium]